jgi:hypothetical protein
VLFRSAWGEIGEAKMLAKLAQQLEKGLKKEGLDVIEKMPKPLGMSYIIYTVQKVDSKLKLEKKLHEDGRTTPYVSSFCSNSSGFPCASLAFCCIHDMMRSNF